MEEIFLLSAEYERLNEIIKFLAENNKVNSLHLNFDIIF